MLTLRARAVLPIAGSPIRDGVVAIRGRRIAYVGRWRDLPAARRKGAIDLGEVLLLPGLINAHCHLDYTQMAGQLPPQKRFSDWLKLIVTTKGSWTLDDYRASWEAGGRMLLQHGTTAVADIEAVPELLPEVWSGTPLRIFSFLEMIGISPRRAPSEVLRDTLRTLTRHRARCFRAGLSPHAPYSTTAELLELTGQAGRRRGLPLCIHVGESQAEFEMFRYGGGEMFDWLARSGRDMRDCGGVSPVAHVERCGGLVDGTLAVHANYLGRGDAPLLRRRQVSVVHCPRSHAYFSHARFPLSTLEQAGVNVCLGTDSLATVYQRRSEKVELDMFAEMRALQQSEPSVSAHKLLAMCTVRGARALGMAGQLGQLSVGALADVIGLPLPSPTGSLFEAAVNHQGPVYCSLIDGKWALPPGKHAHA